MSVDTKLIRGYIYYPFECGFLSKEKAKLRLHQIKAENKTRHFITARYDGDYAVLIRISDKKLIPRKIPYERVKRNV